MRDYIEFYNKQRPHQSLEYKTPEMIHFAEKLENYQEAI
ncbi:integrase core domain-containing protein [Rickettsia endosymbiont of Polydrusus tereticollis]